MIDEIRRELSEIRRKPKEAESAEARFQDWRALALCVLARAG
jgi:hypothetical protein